MESFYRDAGNDRHKEIANRAKFCAFAFPCRHFDARCFNSVPSFFRISNKRWEKYFTICRTHGYLMLPKIPQFLPRDNAMESEHDEWPLTVPERCVVTPLYFTLKYYPLSARHNRFWSDCVDNLAKVGRSVTWHLSKRFNIICRVSAYYFVRRFSNLRDCKFVPLLCNLFKSLISK